MKSKFIQIVNHPVSLLRAKWIIVLVSVFSSMLTYAQVSINTDGSAPPTSAMLEVKSTTKGFLMPRMNLATRPAAPVTGLAIYQLDSSPGIYYYDGAAWQKMSLAAYDFWNPNGPNIYFNAGRVAIGLTDPDSYGLNVSNYVTGRAAVRGGDENGANTYAVGYLGVLSPFYLGVPLSVVNVGVLGVKSIGGNNGAAVYGWNNDVNNENYAGIFYTDGNNNNTATNYGVYSVADKAKYNYAGYFKSGVLGAGLINYGIYSTAEKAPTNYAGYFKGRVAVEGFDGTSAAPDSTASLFTSIINHTRSIDSYAVYGKSRPQPGYGYGIYGYGGWHGVHGVADGYGYTGSVYGVSGAAYSGTNGTAIGVYGYASGGTTNWASYFLGSNYMSGDLRIGTTTAATGYALSINGKVACTEVLVQNMSAWPDYVFKSDYKLRSLENLEQSIKENGHLPGLPSAREIESEGLHLGNMQKQVVEKIEELTLYTIEQGKMLKEMKSELELLKAENASLRKSLKK